MPISSVCSRGVVAAALVLGFVLPAAAAEIGQIKVAKGEVTIERGGQVQTGSVGMRLQTSDVVKTGADGSVGINMSDNSLLSLGPNSLLSLDRYEFDSTTHQARRRRCRTDRWPWCRRIAKHRRTRDGARRCWVCAAPNCGHCP
jgi:hypothetical protein